MLDKFDRKWRALPEWARWILWLPVALILTTVLSWTFGAVARASFFMAKEWAGEFGRTLVSAVILLPLVYFLVPRGKKGVTSVFFAVIFIACALTVVRVGTILFDANQKISHHDAVEFMQAIVWLTAGIGTFWSCMRGDLERPNTI